MINIFGLTGKVHLYLKDLAQEEKPDLVVVTTDVTCAQADLRYAVRTVGSTVVTSDSPQ